MEKYGIMNRAAVFAVCVVVSAGCCSSKCDLSGAPESVAIESRVAADFEGKSAPVYHYAVPPMSDIQRLADVYPSDGTPGGSVNIVTAKDEFEPGSFLVWANKDLGKVAFTLSEFKNEKGDVFPAEDLDLKFVKVWYQNKNAWFSYFGDTDFKLCPELLVNDEDIVRVDTAKKANYARLVDKDGKVSEHWLNPPRRFNRRQLTQSWRSTERFHCMREDFFDAPTLKPVTLPKNEFRNFFLTVHARKNTKSGLYKGAVKMTAKNGKALGEIPVAVRVLDFTLPQPKCYAQPQKDFLVSAYSYMSFDGICELNGYNLPLAHKQMDAFFKNLAEHNQTMHMVRGNMNNEAFETIEKMRKNGMRIDVLQGVTTSARGESKEGHAKRVAAELDRRYGHHNVYIGYGDEPPARWFVKNRDHFKAYQGAGLKFFIAGGNQVFYKAGYFYDWHNTASLATDGTVPGYWNKMQNDNRSAWYAVPHVGTENPSLNRRVNGMGAYLSGYTALCNYAHHFGPWNDDSTTYKPMVLAYGVSNGVIDTLAWEGFREGIDDIRYATLMTDLARKAQKSSDLNTRYLGGKAMHYLATLDHASADQDAVRAEMIRYTTELMKVVTPSEIKSEFTVDKLASEKAAKDLNEEFEAEKKALEAKHAKDKVKTAYHLAVAKLYAKYFRENEGGKYLESVGLYGAAFAYYHFLPEDIMRLSKKAFAEGRGKGPGNGRDIAFWNLVADDASLASEFKSVFFEHIKPTDTNKLKRAISGVMSKELGSQRRLFVNERIPAFVAIADQMWELIKKYDIVPNNAFARNSFDAYMMVGRYDDAYAAAMAGLKDAKAKDIDKYRLGLSAAIAKISSSPKKVVEAIREFDKTCELKISNKDRVAQLSAVGSVINALGNREDVIRKLEEYRKSLYVPTPKKRYQVKFSDKTITGIGDIEKFIAPMTVYDRRYGGSMEFLTTDVTSGDRGKVGSTKEVIPDAKMKVVADERGIHFLVVCDDPKARDVGLGLVGGGSFEAYIAPGENEPYICMMMNPLSKKMTVFNTMFSTFGYRFLNARNDTAKYKVDCEYRDGSIAFYFFLSWDNWAERIPSDGSVWDFENMYWNRAGNQCWNGTESIHGRSTWGELEFKLTAAQRAKILKPLVCRAFAEYKSEKICHGAKNGIIEWAKDPEFCEVEFYESEVKPLVAELDKLGEEVKGDMDDATVLRLAKSALPRWLNVSFEIQRRRARWLQKKEIGL